MEKLSSPIPFGKYELLERIAVGGMAEVYRARLRGEGGFEKHLVIKRILPHLSIDAEFVVMLIDEAKIAVCLAHPNIVQVYDLGKIDGNYFIAMEFIEGGDLKVVLRRCQERNLRFPLGHAIYIINEVLKGLEYAHHKSTGSQDSPVPLEIIHRDISPPNILLSYEGEVKIVDFGIAKASTRMMETSAGIVKGKFEYMSPEQASGLTVDARSDLFSAALILYELVTGHNPFTAQSDLQVIQSVRTGRVAPASRLNPEVPRRLEQILSRALSRDPEARFQRASELRSELMAFAYESGNVSNASRLAGFMRDLFEEDVRAGRSASSSPPSELRADLLGLSQAGGPRRSPVELLKPVQAPPSPPLTPPTLPAAGQTSASQTSTVQGSAAIEGPTVEGTINPRAAAGPASAHLEASSRPSASYTQAVSLLQDMLEKSEVLPSSRPAPPSATPEPARVTFSFFHDQEPPPQPVNPSYGFDDEDVVTTIFQLPPTSPPTTAQLAPAPARQAPPQPPREPTPAPPQGPLPAPAPLPSNARPVARGEFPATLPSAALGGASTAGSPASSRPLSRGDSPPTPMPLAPLTPMSRAVRPTEELELDAAQRSVTLLAPEVGGAAPSRGGSFASSPLSGPGLPSSLPELGNLASMSGGLEPSLPPRRGEGSAPMLPDPTDWPTRLISDAPPPAEAVSLAPPAGEGLPRGWAGGPNFPPGFRAQEPSGPGGVPSLSDASARPIGIPSGGLLGGLPGAVPGNGSPGSPGQATLTGAAPVALSGHAEMPSAFGATRADPSSVFGATRADAMSPFGASRADPPSVFGTTRADPPSAFGATRADPPSVFGASRGEPPSAFGATRTDAVSGPSSGRSDPSPFASTRVDPPSGFSQGRVEPVSAYGAARGERSGGSGVVSAEGSGPAASRGEALSGGRAHDVSSALPVDGRSLSQPRAEGLAPKAAGISGPGLLVAFVVGLIPGLLLALYVGVSRSQPRPEPVATPAPVSARSPKLTIKASQGVTTVLNGNPVGDRYPLELSLTPHREHQVKLSQPGYQEFDTSIRLMPGESVLLMVPYLPPLATSPTKTEDDSP